MVSKVPTARKHALDLAKTDPQIQSLMPDPDVGKAARRQGLSYQQVISAILDGYAGRPALGERAYALGRDRDTGRTRRSTCPTSARSPTGSCTTGSGAWQPCGGTTSSTASRRVTSCAS